MLGGRVSGSGANTPLLGHNRGEPATPPPYDSTPPSAVPTWSSGRRRPIAEPSAAPSLPKIAPPICKKIRKPPLTSSQKTIFALAVAGVVALACVAVALWFPALYPQAAAFIGLPAASMKYLFIGGIPAALGLLISAPQLPELLDHFRKDYLDQVNAAERKYRDAFIKYENGKAAAQSEMLRCETAIEMRKNDGQPSLAKHETALATAKAELDRYKPETPSRT